MFDTATRWARSNEGHTILPRAADVMRAGNGDDCRSAYHEINFTLGSIFFVLFQSTQCILMATGLSAEDF
jgi:hypothetical protein